MLRGFFSNLLYQNQASHLEISLMPNAKGGQKAAIPN